MQRIEGLTIDLALDTTALNRGLTGLKDKLRTVNSEMKANMSAFDRGDKSVGAYETRLNGLNRKLEVQKAVTKAAKEHYEKMVREHGEGSKQADKAAASYNNQVAALNNLERYVGKTREELERLREQQRIAQSGWTQFGNQLNETGTRLTKIGDSMKNAGRSMSMYVTAPIAGIGVMAIKTGMDFEESMSKVAAISGATGKDFKALENQARELGASTKFTAKEASEGMQYLALAGFKTKDIMSAMPGMLDLAAAGAMDLGKAADITSDTMQAFGMKATEASHAADVFAYAQANANTNVEQMGEALKYSAPAAHAFGWSLEETSAATMVFANSGLKGSIAGQAFASSLTRLAKPTKKMGKLWEATNSEFFDAAGNLKSMPDLVKELEIATRDMTQEQRAGYLATTFGAEAYKHWVILLESGSENLRTMTNDLTNADGAASKMAKTMNDNAKGDINMMVASIQELSIQIYKILEPTIRNLIQTFTGLVEKVQKLPKEFKLATVIIGGLVAAIGPLLLVGGMFIGFLGNALTGISKLFPAIARAGGLLNFLRLGLAALTGPVGIVIGVLTLLGAGFVLLYKNSETFREGIHNLITKIKDLAKDALAVIKPAIQAVIQFFKDQLAILQKFWQENSDVIIQALKNISTVVGVIFQGIFAVIKFIMPAVLAIIKMVWENIKGVISGALDVIMGLVKVFSGLFTGNFSKMWEGIKQVFFGALELIWNGVQLMFWGKMLKGILSLGKLLVSGFKSTWGSIQNVFSTVIEWIVNFVKNRFTAMQNTTNSILTGIKNIISTIWNAILSFFKSVIQSIFDFVKNRFTSMQSTVSSIITTIKNVISTIWNGILSFFKSVIQSIFDLVKGRFDTLKTTVEAIFTAIRNTAKTIWNAVKDYIYNPIKDAVTNTLTKFNSLKSQLGEIFGTIKNNVKGYVADMVETVKGMPQKMGDGLKSTASKIGDGLKAVANKMTETLGKGVNGVITGVNWVLDKVGVSKKIGDWKVPQYATGTDNHPGGPAIVGEKGRELAHVPGVGYTMLGEKGSQFLNLPAGTSVLPNKQTENLLSGYFPGYANGIGWLSSAWEGTKNIAKNIKDTAFDVWSYISDPGKLFNKAMEAFGVETPSFPGALKDVGTGAFTKIKDSMLGYMKGLISDFDFGGSLGAPPGKGVERWRNVILQAAAAMKESITDAELNGILAQIQRESGGNEKIVQSSAVWDINTASGNPARGLLQYIPQTFSRYAVKGHSNIYSGYDQLLAFFNNTSWKKNLPYGKRGWGATGKRKFATGGLIKSRGLYELAEGGWPEFVIPTDPSRRTDAMKLLALAGKTIDTGNKRPSQLPNVSGSSGDDTLSKLLEATLEQTKVLLQLLNKDTDIYMDGATLTNGVQDHLNYQYSASLRAAGVRR
ncbi:phage tail tape measure protein [Bacillus cihuensis]|uniref:phage tail tape measure protein n=1 Tax=Bacillus cihuensis TaxID=1208599 RepID=UPI0004006B1B|nr:phage tail tape measure protein [Bacillus cihuensis]